MRKASLQGKLRGLMMGICLHILVSGFLAAGIRVYQSGYDHTHAEPIQAASLHVTGNTAELSVLDRTVSVSLPEVTSGSQLLWFAVVDGNTIFWFVLFDAFIK